MVIYFYNTDSEEVRPRFCISWRQRCDWRPERGGAAGRAQNIQMLLGRRSRAHNDRRERVRSSEGSGRRRARDSAQHEALPRYVAGSHTTRAVSPRMQTLPPAFIDDTLSRVRCQE